MRKKTKSVVKEIQNEIETDSNLLAQVQAYVQEIEANPQHCGWAHIIIGGEYLPFLLVNNIPQNPEEMCYDIQEGPGVSLLLILSSLNEENKEAFENCKLYPLFYECTREGNEENFYINFSFDTKSLCIAIQHLGECFGYSAVDNIEIKMASEEDSECEEPTNPSLLERICSSRLWMGIIGVIIVALIKVGFSCFSSDESVTQETASTTTSISDTPCGTYLVHLDIDRGYTATFVLNSNGSATVTWKHGRTETSIEYYGYWERYEDYPRDHVQVTYGDNIALLDLKGKKLYDNDYDFRSYKNGHDLAKIK